MSASSIPDAPSMVTPEPPPVAPVAPTMAKYDGYIPLVYDLASNRDEITTLLHSSSTESLEGTAAIYAGNGLQDMWGGDDPQPHEPTVRARSAKINQPLAICMGTRPGSRWDGWVFFTTASHRVKQISPDGALSNVAGVRGYGQQSRPTDGPCDVATFYHPTGIALDEDRGVLYVADRDNHIIRAIIAKPSTSDSSSSDSKGSSSHGHPHDQWDRVITIAGEAPPRFDYTLGRLPDRASAYTPSFNSPSSLAFDHKANILYVADFEAVKAFHPSLDVANRERTRIWTIIGGPQTLDRWGQPLRPWTGQATHGREHHRLAYDKYLKRGPRDLGRAGGIAIDTKDNRILITDYGRHVVWCIPRMMALPTVAATGTTLTTPLHTPRIIAGQLDKPGQFEGEALTEAGFDSPTGIAVDHHNGTLFIADSGNHVIRGITRTTPATTTGTTDGGGDTSRATYTVYSMVGSGSYGCCQGTGPLAEFYSPDGMAFHPETYSMVLTEAKSNYIRVVDVSVPRRHFLALVAKYSEAQALRAMPADVVGVIVQYTHRVHTSNLPDDYRFNLSSSSSS